jgi:hypothetical protein
LARIVRKRQKTAGLVKKTAWALYAGKSLEKIIDQIKGFIDDLEKLFPMESLTRDLAALEVKDLGHGQALAALQEAADGTDIALFEAVAQTRTHCVVPFPRNEELVVQQLERLLPSSGEYRSAALWGLGGSGFVHLPLLFKGTC